MTVRRGRGDPSDTSAPFPKVRDTSQHTLTRPSETKGHWQLYDSSAAFRFEVPNRVCCRRCRNFKSAALAAKGSSRPSWRPALSAIHHRRKIVLVLWVKEAYIEPIPIHSTRGAFRRRSEGGER